MTNITFIGIDPGAKGAICWLYPDGTLSVSDCPLDEKRRVNHQELARLVSTQSTSIRGPEIAYIEGVHAMPGQGVSSMFSLGGNYNSWLQVLACNHIKTVIVTPKSWKNKMGLSADKQVSVNRASNLFPSYKHLFYGSKGGLKDGRAEAVLLAYLARQEWIQKNDQSSNKKT